MGEGKPYLDFNRLLEAFIMNISPTRDAAPQIESKPLPKHGAAVNLTSFVGMLTDVPSEQVLDMLLSSAEDSLCTTSTFCARPVRKKCHL